MPPPPAGFPTGRSPRSRLAVLRRTVLPCLLAGVVLGAALVTPGAAPVPAVADAPVEGREGRCSGSDTRFKPARLAIPGVVRATKVLPRGRDGRGVPIPPPLTDRGKWQLAWDKTVRAGARRGVVRMTAHTYPWSGAYGSALGNKLLRQLHKGARLVVSGAGEGQRRCYRVTRRVQVRASSSIPAYYSSTGRHRLAILVCSGRRLGPGNWSHRTIWYAE